MKGEDENKDEDEEEDGRYLNVRGCKMKVKGKMK